MVDDNDMNDNKDSEYTQSNDQKEMLDWIDTQNEQEQHTKSDDLMYHNIQQNLKHLKMRKSKKINITRPNEYIPFYNYSKQQTRGRRKRKKKRNKHRKRSNSVPTNRRKQLISHKIATKEDKNLTFKPKINAYEFNRRIDPDVQRRLQIWNIQKKMKRLNG